MDDLSLMDYEWEAIINEIIRLFIIPEMNRNNVNATFNMQKSLGAKGNKLMGAHYEEWADRGRGPGGMPPINKIKEWVEVKLNVADSTSVAYAIAHKIAKEGTQNHIEGGMSRFLYVIFTPRCREFINQKAGEILTRKVRVNINNFIKSKL